MKRTLRECINKLKEITNEADLEKTILYLQGDSKGKLFELYCNGYIIRIRAYKIYIHPSFTAEYKMDFYIEIYNASDVWFYFGTIITVTHKSIIEYLTNKE